MKDFRTSRLGRPEVNAALGAFYLWQVLDGFGGNAVLAAAYNAGPGRASRWRDAKPLEGAIYVETIPFAETRQYVKKVMVNAVYYAALLGGEQRSLKSRLGTSGRMSGFRPATRSWTRSGNVRRHQPFPSSLDIRSSTGKMARRDRKQVCLEPAEGKGGSATQQEPVPAKAGGDWSLTLHRRSSHGKNDGTEDVAGTKKF